MNDPEARPRPQYGEYATPEEQRARIEQPDTTRLLETGQDPDARRGAESHEQPVLAAKPLAAKPARTESVATKPAGPMTRGRFADCVATIALLVYGLINVISSLPGMIDYGSYASTVLELLGIDAQLADPTTGRPWGIAAALVFAIGWLLTAYVSWWNLSHRRVTWWIPLVAGIVFSFVTGVLLMVPIVSDPTLWSAILDSTR